MSYNFNYRSLREHVDYAGASFSPDGKPCRELFVHKTTFDMGEAVGRDRMNPKLGFMEGLQMIAGTADKKAVLLAAPKVDIGMFTIMSFYGPRVKDQVPTVINELVRDPLSRRAVLTVANDPQHDIPNNTEPCTIALQFLLRGRLHLVAYMRSSDVVWGVPYDVMQFGLFGLAVAACLGVKPGWVYMVGGSVHEYVATKDFAATTESRHFRMVPSSFSFTANMTPLDRWGILQGWATNNVFFAKEYWLEDGIPPGLEWYDGGPWADATG